MNAYVTSWIVPAALLLALSACGEPQRSAAVLIITDDGGPTTPVDEPDAPEEPGTPTDDEPADDEPAEIPAAAQLEPGLFGLGGAGREEGYEVESLPDGSLVVVGTFSGELRLGEFSATALDADDVFVARLSPDLEVQWLSTWGGEWMDYLQRIAVDEVGDVYVSSSYTNEVELGGRVHEFEGQLDALLVKLDGATGEVVWTTNFGGPNYDGLRDMVVWDGVLWAAGYVGSPLELGGTAVGSTLHGTSTSWATSPPTSGRMASISKPE